MCRTIFFILPARKKISPSNVIPYIPSCKLIKLVIAKVVFSQLEAELVEKKTRKENELRKKGRERNPFFPDLIFSIMILKNTRELLFANNCFNEFMHI